MRQRLTVWFWDHFHPDRKRFMWIRKLRRVDGWMTRMESISPHAEEFIERAEQAVYQNHPPRIRTHSGLLPRQACVDLEESTQLSLLRQRQDAIASRLNAAEDGECGGFV